MIVFLDAATSSVALLAIIFLALLLIMIQVAIIRWVFKIDTQINNQKATVWLLIKLCEKHSVDPGELEKIMQTFKIK